MHMDLGPFLHDVTHVYFLVVLFIACFGRKQENFYISLVSLPKEPKKSRSILLDGSRFWGFFERKTSKQDLF